MQLVWYGEALCHIEIYGFVVLLHDDASAFALYIWQPECEVLVAGAIDDPIFLVAMWCECEKTASGMYCA